MHLRLVVFHPDSLTFLESTGGLAHRLSLRQNLLHGSGRMKLG
jgi:hypothetical protein